MTVQAGEGPLFDQRIGLAAWLAGPLPLPSPAHFLKLRLLTPPFGARSLDGAQQTHSRRQGHVWPEDPLSWASQASLCPGFILIQNPKTPRRQSSQVVSAQLRRQKGWAVFPALTLRKGCLL